MTNPALNHIDPVRLRAPAGYIKADLHVHSPVSACYDPEFRRVTTDQVLEEAAARHLQAIVLTDHNSAAAVDDYRIRAEAFGIAVFPGTEITTVQGHILAIFDTDIATETVWSLLEAAGVPSGTHGDGTQRVRASMLEVIEAIAERGGLAIPAHIDRFPNGFWTSLADRKGRSSIYHHQAIEAVEITAHLDKPRWTTGNMPGAPLPRTVVQNSDAHAPIELSRRPTLYRLDTVGLGDIRQAMRHHDDAIRFPHELAAQAVPCPSPGAGRAEKNA